MQREHGKSAVIGPASSGVAKGAGGGVEALAGSCIDQSATSADSGSMRDYTA
jgi:hypothetical protein